MRPIIILLLTLVLTFAVCPQDGDAEHPTSLQGLTEAMLIDGQPALRFLTSYGATTYAELVKRDGEDALTFTVIRFGDGNLTRLKYGRLYVTAKNVIFDPDEKKSSYFNIPKTDVKEITVDTPGIGGVAGLLKYRDEKTFLLLNYSGPNQKIRKAELWPATSFMVRTIADFGKAMAEFNALTESARPRVVIDEDEAEDEFTVSDRYDRFQDATVVATSKMMLKGGKRSIRTFAEYSTPGKAQKKPATVTFYLYSSGSTALFREDALGLIFLVDDQRFTGNTMKIADEEKTSTSIRQTVSIELPYDTFAKIAGGKKVEFQIGKLEYKLTDANLEAFKKLLAYKLGDQNK